MKRNINSNVYDSVNTTINKSTNVNNINSVPSTMNNIANINSDNVNEMIDAVVNARIPVTQNVNNSVFSSNIGITGLEINKKNNR